MKNFIDHLTHLYKHDLALCEVYKSVINNVKTENILKKLKDFLKDHENHLSTLEILIKENNGSNPSDWRDLKGVLLDLYAKLRSFVSEEGALKALMTAEKELFEAYKEDLPNDINDNTRNKLLQILEDEKKHMEYLDSLINKGEQTMADQLSKNEENNSENKKDNKNKDINKGEKTMADQLNKNEKNISENEKENPNKDINKNGNKDDSRHKAGVKRSMGGSGSPDKASPAAVERYLKGIKFPASKNDLVNKAKENNAPSDVMHVIGLFDDKKEFHSPIDVSKEVGRVE